jgi:hypothetical protein
MRMPRLPSLSLPAIVLGNTLPTSVRNTAGLRRASSKSATGDLQHLREIAFPLA